jgi:WD40 repeat protein
VAFTPDGTLLASASYDHTIRLWDAQNRKLVGEPLRGHSQEIYRLAFSPDGRTLSSASGDHTVRLWDVETRRTLRTLRGGDDASAKLAIAFSPDGRSLVSGSFGGKVQLWDVGTGQGIGGPLIVDAGHGVQADLAVAFSPDGNTVVAAEEDGFIRLQSLKQELMIARACSRANRNLTAEEWAQYIGADARYHLTCPALPGLSLR